MRGDSGRIVIGGITKIIGCLAIIVVLFHDGVSLGVAQVTTDQDAQVAARAAAQSYSQSVTARGQTVQTATSQSTARTRQDDVDKAYKAAALAVAEKGTDIDAATFRIAANGEVTLTATRRTSTMVADHFSWFNSVTHPHSTTTAAVSPIS